MHGRSCSSNRRRGNTCPVRALSRTCSRAGRFQVARPAAHDAGCACRYSRERTRPVLRPAIDNVVDVLAHRHRAHRLRAVGERLGHGEDVGRDIERLGSEIVPGAAQPVDHLVEHQQDAVVRAQFTHAFEVADRRGQAAGGARDRPDEHRGHILRAVRDQRLRSMRSPPSAAVP